MSEGDYEYELQRAELLGLPPPEKKLLPPVSQNDENDEDDTQLELDEENIVLEGDQMGRVSGGLDELNTILNITQKKLNRFKNVCGSFTNLLKLRVGGKKDDGGSDCSSQASEPESDTVPPSDKAPEDSHSGTNNSKPVAVKKTPKKNVDMEAMLGTQVDKLDSMVMKAEIAEISMTEQNKEMRMFLKK